MKLCFIVVVVVVLVLMGNVFVQDVLFEKGKLSYYFGYDYGNNLVELIGCGEQLDINLVVKGLQDVYVKKQLVIIVEQLKLVVEVFQKCEQGCVQVVKVEYEKVVVENKIKSDQFIVVNKVKVGVQFLLSGVQYCVIEVGKGVKLIQVSIVQLEVVGLFLYGQCLIEVCLVQQILLIKVSEVEMKVMCEILLQMLVGLKWEVILLLDQVYGVDLCILFLLNVVVQFEIKLVSVK